MSKVRFLQTEQDGKSMFSMLVERREGGIVTTMDMAGDVQDLVMAMVIEMVRNEEFNDFVALVDETYIRVLMDDVLRAEILAGKDIRDL